MNKTQANIGPDLTPLLDVLKQEIMVALNCHAIGTIQSFDNSRCTAQITMNYPKTIGGKSVPYPVLEDCPVVIASGGPARLTFPIAKGDQCLIAFNDRDIDNWFVSGQVKPLNTPRTHWFGDAFAVVGLNSMASVALNSANFGAYDGARARLAYGRVAIAAGLSKVLLTNGVTSFGSQMSTFFTALQAFVTACESSADATLAAAATALAAPLAIVKVALTDPATGLLE